MAQFGVGGMVLQGPPRPMFLSAQKQQEGGFLDWLLGALDKETFTETDPLLNKVGDSSNGAATSAAAPKQKKGAPAPAPEKKGGLGGFFGKK